MTKISELSAIGTLDDDDVLAIIEDGGTRKVTVAQLRAVLGGSGGDVQYETRSSNTILGVADKGKTIDITATITQTFEADETLGDGWWVDLRNATDEGTVVVTLDPAGSETIDGLTTVTMYSGETRRIICNGAGGNFTSVLLRGGLFRITATGATNFVLPPGASWVDVELQGAGGGGGGANGSGGGGGGRVKRQFAASELGNPGDAIAVSVPTSAAGGSGANGTAGGNCTFGSTLLVAGGGGRGQTNGWRGGAGGGIGEVGQDGTTSASGAIRGGGNWLGGAGGYGEAGGGCPDDTLPGRPAHWGGGGASGMDLGHGGGTSLYGGGGGSAKGGGAGGGTGIYSWWGGGGGSAGSGSGNGGNGADGTIGRGGAGGGCSGNSGGNGGNGGTPGGGGGGGVSGGGSGGRGEAVIRYG